MSQMPENVFQNILKNTTKQQKTSSFHNQTFYTETNEALVWECSKCENALSIASKRHLLLN